MKRTKLDDNTPAVTAGVVPVTTKPVAVVSPTIAFVETECKTSNTKEIHHVSSSQTIVAPVKEPLKTKPDKSSLMTSKVLPKKTTSSCADSDHSHTVEVKKQVGIQVSMIKYIFHGPSTVMRHVGCGCV